MEYQPSDILMRENIEGLHFIFKLFSLLQLKNPSLLHVF
jgi:hypothetical protein